MSKAVKTVFGGTDKSALKAQTKANAATKEFIAQQAGAAREDILRLAPASEEARNLGFQGALDVFGQSVPQQLQAFQGGNVGAQRQIAAGTPQAINALLGQPVDLSVLQPQTLDLNTQFAQQQLPEFTTSAEALAPQQDPQVDLAALLSGRFNFGGLR